MLALSGRLRGQPVAAAFAPLHTKVSGDFMLMAREAWFTIRGYPELPTHSHLDTYGCFCAAAAGFTELVLEDPYRIYHQEHDRSAHDERPLTDLDMVLALGNRLQESDMFVSPNSCDWGMGGLDLEEWRLDMKSAGWTSTGYLAAQAAGSVLES